MLVGIGTMLSVATIAAQAAVVTYNFESLTAETNLLGLDNWTNISMNGSSQGKVTTGWGGGNTTKVAGLTGEDTGYHYLARVNDGNFSFPAFSNTETAALIEFDFRDVNGTGIEYLFGLGAHGGDNLINNFAERVFLIGVNQSNARVYYPGHLLGGLSLDVPFINRTPGPGYTGDLNDWYTLRLVADFAANTGTLYWKNLTQNNPSFTQIGTIPNLLAGATYTPSQWNTLIMAMPGNTQSQVDNLRVGTVEVPEPASLALLALSGTMLLRRRKV